MLPSEHNCTVQILLVTGLVSLVLAINCIESEQFEKFGKGLWIFGASFLPTNATFTQTKYFDSSAKILANLCSRNSKIMSSRNGFTYAAHDLNYIRKALGNSELNYYGIGYGTLAGLFYANLFPRNVGSMILDSPMNPAHYLSRPIFEHISSITKSTSDTLIAITEECDRTHSCALHQKSKFLINSGKKSIETIQSFIEQLLVEPLIAQGTELLVEPLIAQGTELLVEPLITQGTVEPGVVTAEMVEELIFDSLGNLSKWPEIMNAINSAIKGSPEPLYQITFQKRPDLSIKAQKLVNICLETENSNSILLESWLKQIDEIELKNGFAARILGSRYLPW